MKKPKLIITPLSDGMVLIKAQNGRLWSKVAQQFFSEAVVEQGREKEFEAR